MEQIILNGPSASEMAMFGNAMGVAAELVSEDGIDFVGITAARADAGQTIDALANTSVWLASWAAIVEEARTRLLAAAPGGQA